MITEKLVNGCFYRIMDDSIELRQNAVKPMNDRWQEFLDFNVWKDVLDQLNKPYPKMLKDIDNMVNELSHLDVPEPMNIKRHIKYREDRGDEVCLDRLRGGQEFWRGTEKVKSVGEQFKRIFIDMAAPIGIDAELIQWRAAAGIALTMIFEKAGYQVELWAVSYTTETYVNKDGNFIAVKLKDYGDTLDVSNLANVTSGWCYRSIWFANKKRDDVKITKGLGAPTRSSNEQFEEATGVPFNEENDVFLYKLFSEWSAISKIKEVLGQYAPKEEEPEPVEYVPYVYVPAPVVVKSAAQIKKEQKESERWWKEYYIAQKKQALLNKES